jgi:hypothetical protein
MTSGANTLGQTLAFQQQIIGIQNANGAPPGTASGAVGLFQINYTNMKNLSSQLGIDPNTPMTAELQVKIANQLALTANGGQPVVDTAGALRVGTAWAGAGNANASSYANQTATNFNTLQTVGTPNSNPTQFPPNFDSNSATQTTNSDGSVTFTDKNNNSYILKDNQWVDASGNVVGNANFTGTVNLTSAPSATALTSGLGLQGNWSVTNISQNTSGGINVVTYTGPNGQQLNVDSTGKVTDVASGISIGQYSPTSGSFTANPPTLDGLALLNGGTQPTVLINQSSQLQSQINNLQDKLDNPENLSAGDYLVTRQQISDLTAQKQVVDSQIAAITAPSTTTNTVTADTATQNGYGAGFDPASGDPIAPAPQPISLAYTNPPSTFVPSTSPTLYGTTTEPAPGAAITITGGTIVPTPAPTIVTPTSFGNDVNTTTNNTLTASYGSNLGTNGFNTLPSSLGGSTITPEAASGQPAASIDTSTTGSGYGNSDRYLSDGSPNPDYNASSSDGAAAAPTVGTFDTNLSYTAPAVGSSFNSTTSAGGFGLGGETSTNTETGATTTVAEAPAASTPAPTTPGTTPDGGASTPSAAGGATTAAASAAGQGGGC